MSDRDHRDRADDDLSLSSSSSSDGSSVILVSSTIPNCRSTPAPRAAAAVSAAAKRKSKQKKAVDPSARSGGSSDSDDTAEMVRKVLMNDNHPPPRRRRQRPSLAAAAAGGGGTPTQAKAAPKTSDNKGAFFDEHSDEEEENGPEGLPQGKNGPSPASRHDDDYDAALLQLDEENDDKHDDDDGDDDGRASCSSSSSLDTVELARSIRDPNLLMNRTRKEKEGKKGMETTEPLPSSAAEVLAGGTDQDRVSGFRGNPPSVSDDFVLHDDGSDSETSKSEDAMAQEKPWHPRHPPPDELFHASAPTTESFPGTTPRLSPCHPRSPTPSIEPTGGSSSYMECPPQSSQMADPQTCPSRLSAKPPALPQLPHPQPLAGPSMGVKTWRTSGAAQVPLVSVAGGGGKSGGTSSATTPPLPSPPTNNPYSNKPVAAKATTPLKSAVSATTTTAVAVPTTTKPTSSAVAAVKATVPPTDPSPFRDMPDDELEATAFFRSRQDPPADRYQTHQNEEEPQEESLPTVVIRQGLRSPPEADSVGMYRPVGPPPPPHHHGADEIGSFSDSDDDASAAAAFGFCTRALSSRPTRTSTAQQVTDGPRRSPLAQPPQSFHEYDHHHQSTSQCLYNNCSVQNPRSSVSNHNHACASLLLSSAAASLDDYKSIVTRKRQRLRDAVAANPSNASSVMPAFRRGTVPWHDAGHPKPWFSLLPRSRRDLGFSNLPGGAPAFSENLGPLPSSNLERHPRREEVTLSAMGGAPNASTKNDRAWSASFAQRGGSSFYFTPSAAAAAASSSSSSGGARASFGRGQGGIGSFDNVDDYDDDGGVLEVMDKNCGGRFAGSSHTNQEYGGAGGERSNKARGARAPRKPGSKPAGRSAGGSRRLQPWRGSGTGGRRERGSDRGGARGRGRPPGGRGGFSGSSHTVPAVSSSRDDPVLQHVGGADMSF